MDSVLSFITGKTFSGIVFGSVMLLEVSGGFLNRFLSYVRTLSKGFYLKVLAAAVLSVAVLLFFDEALIQKVQGIQKPWVVEIINLGIIWGKSSIIWVFFAALYGIMRVFRWNHLRWIAFACLVSSGLTSLFVHIIKYVFMRARPLLDFGPFHFFDYAGFSKHGSNLLSFSSGDVALSAGVMSLLFFAVKNPLRFLFPGVALLTSFSRMYLDKHWPSDVAFSWVISFAVAKFVWDYVKFKFPEFAAGGKELHSRS